MNPQEKLNHGSCIAELPNGELFCFGKRDPPSGVTLIIDKNYLARPLPSGTPCCYSSAIFYKNSVYCFGGKDNNAKALPLSEKYDLSENRWIKLNPLPKVDRLCNSVIFKDNIVISGFYNKNLLWYSIDSDSFRTIPYEFAENQKKILISAERLVLIECNGLIYESEVGDESKWKQIANSISTYAVQMSYLFNKGGIYIKASLKEMPINNEEENITTNLKEMLINDEEEKVPISESVKKVEKKEKAIKNKKHETKPKNTDEADPLIGLLPNPFKGLKQKPIKDSILESHHLPISTIIKGEKFATSSEESSPSDEEINSDEDIYNCYINDFNQDNFIYLTKEVENKTYLFIYDTENNKEDERELDTPVLLDHCACVCKLPNCELFCFGGKNPLSGLSLIIDCKSWRIRILPSGTPCYFSSSIYFENNIYCFGGVAEHFESITLSQRFDLELNKWIRLNPLPQPDGGCHCIIYNKNILIVGFESQHILQYSIEGNFFWRVPFEFEKFKRKILIDTGRFYLLECGSSIYESEVGDYAVWKQVGKSIISSPYPAQLYCSINKRSLFIGIRNPDKYYVFNLDEKTMIEHDEN